ncbi:hypothetical protein KY319_03350 [Candidatus Woesearchaeota archaeon]|nr:hypothetical protein [Candidatus Woesearchaeota archaeon]
MNNLKDELKQRMRKTYELIYQLRKLERGVRFSPDKEINPEDVEKSIKALVNRGATTFSYAGEHAIDRIYAGGQTFYLFPEETTQSPSALRDFALRAVCPPLTESSLTPWGLFEEHKDSLVLGGFDFEEEIGVLLTESRRELTLKGIEGKDRPAMYAQGAPSLEYHAKQPYVIMVKTEIRVFPNLDIAEEVKKNPGTYLRAAGVVLPRKLLEEKVEAR